MTPKQFEQLTGMSGRATAKLVGLSPSGYRRWKNSKTRQRTPANKILDSYWADYLRKTGDYRLRRLSEMPAKMKQAEWQDCYEQGAAADKESECPYGADLGRRCAWMAGFWDTIESTRRTK